MAYAVGDRVVIKVDQDDGTTKLVPGTVSTVSDETPYGITIDGDDVESTWYVDSELDAAPSNASDPPPEPDDTTTAAARRGTRKINQPNAATVRLDAAKRIKAIVKSEYAVGREALAEHLAYDTIMSAVDAVAVLAKSPKAEASKPGNRFDRAMEQAGNPDVGPDASGDQGQGTGTGATPDPTQRILANYRAATGAKAKSA